MLMLKDETRHLTGCSSVDLHNLLTSTFSAQSEFFFLHKAQKLCHILVIKQLPYMYNPTSPISKEIDYFKVVLPLKQQ